MISLGLFNFNFFFYFILRFNRLNGQHALLFLLCGLVNRLSAEVAEARNILDLRAAVLAEHKTVLLEDLGLVLLNSLFSRLDF